MEGEQLKPGDTGTPNVPDRHAIDVKFKTRRTWIKVRMADLPLEFRDAMPLTHSIKKLEIAEAEIRQRFASSTGS